MRTLAILHHVLEGSSTSGPFIFIITLSIDLSITFGVTCVNLVSFDFLLLATTDKCLEVAVAEVPESLTAVDCDFTTLVNSKNNDGDEEGKDDEECSGVKASGGFSNLEDIVVRNAGIFSVSSIMIEYSHNKTIFVGVDLVIKQEAIFKSVNFISANGDVGMEGSVVTEVLWGFRLRGEGSTDISNNERRTANVFESNKNGNDITGKCSAVVVLIQNL